VNFDQFHVTLEEGVDCLALWFKGLSYNQASGQIITLSVVKTNVALELAEILFQSRHLYSN